MAAGPGQESAESSGLEHTPNYNRGMQLLGTSSGQSADAKARSARDAGVGASSVAFDETLPFPPPVHRVTRQTDRGLSRRDGLSLEQMTEASLARARGELAELAPASETPVRVRALTASVEAAPVESAPVESAPGATEGTSGRLHWRGRELSPEFHEYALRVSRGENLEPFRGKLLADEARPLPGEPADALPLPWESANAVPLRSKAPRTIGLLLAALALVVLVTGSLTSQEEAPAWSATAPASAASTVVASLQPSAQVVSSSSLPALELAPGEVAPAASASAVVAPAAVAPAAVPPPAVAAAALPPAAVARAHKPAPAPAAMAAAPSTSALLVEKPPF
jgi:hypothetical protein